MISKDSLVDFHIHTTASDGTWNNDDILKHIKKNNIKFFSITDHDTLENSIKILNNIPDDLKYFIGVEISSTYKDKEFHILGYNFDYKNVQLSELLKFNNSLRVEHNRKVVQYVIEKHKDKEFKDYDLYNYDRIRGGWKSLNYLIDYNIVKDYIEYFGIVNLISEKMIFKHPSEVIKIIKNAGGVPILAHPSAYNKGELLPLEVLDDWRSFGISGIECFSPYLKNIEDANYYVEYCNKNNLMISAGSDCHGEFNNRCLGNPKVTLEKVRLDFI